jgi:hypothetical protein
LDFLIHQVKKCNEIIITIIINNKMKMIKNFFVMIRLRLDYILRIQFSSFPSDTKSMYYFFFFFFLQEKSQVYYSNNQIFYFLTRKISSGVLEYYENIKC